MSWIIRLSCLISRHFLFTRQTNRQMDALLLYLSSLKLIQEEFSLLLWLKRESFPSEKQQEWGLEISYLCEQKVPAVHQQLLLATYGHWSPPMGFTVTWFNWEICPTIYISLLHFGASQFYQMLLVSINIFYSWHHYREDSSPPLFGGGIEQHVRKDSFYFQ